MKARAWARRRVRLFIRSQLIKGRFLALSVGLKPLRGAEAHVLMCLWNRPSRIETVLEMLDGQNFPPGIRLYLWNNNRSDHDVYVKAIREYTAKPDGVLRRVQLVKSPHNLGSIARFYWARKIQLGAPNTPVIVIDDDQDVTADFIADTVAAYDPATVTAWWAFTVGNAYWDRQPAAPGDRVDHVGPGGSIMSSSIFDNPQFFTDIPDAYRLLDDVWLSYFARKEGYGLAKLDVDMVFVLEETNQHHGQAGLKAEFFDYLYGAGSA
jgi:hypothetical protein